MERDWNLELTVLMPWLIEAETGTCIRKARRAMSIAHHRARADQSRRPTHERRRVQGFHVDQAVSMTRSIKRFGPRRDNFRRK